MSQNIFVSKAFSISIIHATLVFFINFLGSKKHLHETRNTQFCFMPIPIHFEFSRRLRKESTPEEKKVWELLRNRRFHQLKFTRQYPIVISKKNEQKKFFIADFYCASLKFILEIDGGIHEKQTEYDNDRDHILIEMGYNVIRIKNENINEDAYKALKIIEELIKDKV